MRRSIGTAFAAALVLGLAGCGGGGGGGGGGGIALPPVGAVPTPPATVSELKLTVEIAGSAATPDGAGKYTVAPGQLVVVKASDNVAWLGSAQATGVTRTDVDTSATQWISRFANPGATDGSYKLVASASGDRSKELNFVVQTGDYRNGDYLVFAANGSRQMLSIDFDKATYSVTDAAGDKTTGTLTKPAIADNPWDVLNSRITSGGVNTSSLYGLGDTVIGAFPFAAPFSNPVTYSAAPFVASRALVMKQGNLDGAYNRARIEVTATGRESAIAQIEISGGGTVMKQCTDLIIYRIDKCPQASLVTSAIAADGDTGLWTLKNPADGSLLGRFAIADVDGEKVYLSAGSTVGGASQVFAIGVPESAGYADFHGIGWSTDATFDVSSVASSQYTVSLWPVQMKTLTLAPLAVDSPTGMRFATDGADTYFAMRSRRLETLIGARSQPATRGFLHLGLAK